MPVEASFWKRWGKTHRRKPITIVPSSSTPASLTPSGCAALLSRRGQNDRAIADIEASTRLRPDDASGFKDRGGVLVRLGQYQRAIDTLNRAIELDPNRAAAYLNRGAAYNGMGQYERAIDDLNKAIALDPKNPGATRTSGWPIT